MNMPATGRRSKAGGLHGPMNHPSVNATQAAMLAAQGFNSDVQIPYRLPITEASHSKDCPEPCVEAQNEAVMIEAAQRGQDARQVTAATIAASANRWRTTR